MDPDRALEDLRSYVRNVRHLSRDDALDALELFGELDNWLTAGGFVPNAWHRER
jgi:hypothetical protein